MRDTHTQQQPEGDGVDAGEVRLVVRGRGAVLTGWVMGAPDDAMPPEIAVATHGSVPQIVLAEQKTPASAPEGALGFAWPVPARFCDGVQRSLRVWSLSEGRELSGSPVALAHGEPGSGEDTGGWILPLAGHVGTGLPLSLAADCWIGAEPPAHVLRYEMITGLAQQAAPPRRGIRLVADVSTARLSIWSPLDPARDSDRVVIEAWLPEAGERLAQAHGEVWLMARRAGSFHRLRRLRRLRLFRRPAVTLVDVSLGEDEAREASEGALWLAVEALQARGLAAFPPSAETVQPAAMNMEDVRLEGAFAALAARVRVQAAAAEATSATERQVRNAASGDCHPFTQIILPVYNGDVVVRDCLNALRNSATGPFQVVVVDDASRQFTAEILRAAVGNDPRFVLHRRDINRGYTKSINEAVALTRAPWVVVLNSDTVVSTGWLDRMHAAAAARGQTGMVGPLSNAATWQSIPDVRRGTDWATNDQIEPHHVEAVQSLLDEVSAREYPAFPVLNGFCTLISRAVFDRIGLYDEDAFPMGYGEETDLCLRARAAGFRLTLADDCFVFHHKSVSFGAAGRRPLTRAGGFELRNKHLGLNIPALERVMQACPTLARLRARLLDRLPAVTHP